MKTRLTKSLCVLLAALLFVEAALAASAESNIWADRRTQMEQAQLAQLPANPTLLNQMPSLGKALLANKPVVAAASKPEARGVRGLADSISALHGTVQSVYDANTAAAPVVIFQDIHLNAEAQTNLAALLQDLIDQNKVGFVGVEGAFGEMDFAPFRAAATPEIVKGVADEFLEHDLMAAPSYVGLTTPSNEVRFVGVDHRAAYERNVQAYLTSRNLKDRAAADLFKEQSELAARKKIEFTPELLAFDAKRMEYRSGKMGLGEYLKGLANGEPELEQFLAAYEMESKLDFARVEIERRRVIEKLTAALSQSETNELIARSLAYRLGRSTFSAYYASLKNLCESKGLDLKQTPHFDNYIRYVLLSDGINAEKLFAAVETREREILATLITTPAQQQLADESERLSLTAKLLGFELTPQEWEKYSSLRGTKQSQGALRSFESFYGQADTRSEKMVSNLILEKSAKGKILIVGGFHTPHISRLLRDQKISHIIVSPKVTKIEEGAGSKYLNIFAREKTSLDKLFAGERLFINPREAQVTHPANGIPALALMQARAARTNKTTVAWRVSPQTVWRFVVKVPRIGWDRARYAINRRVDDSAAEMWKRLNSQQAYGALVGVVLFRDKFQPVLAVFWDVYFFRALVGITIAAIIILTWLIIKNPPTPKKPLKPINPPPKFKSPAPAPAPKPSSLESSMDVKPISTDDKRIYYSMYHLRNTPKFVTTDERVLDGVRRLGFIVEGNDVEAQTLRGVQRFYREAITVYLRSFGVALEKGGTVQVEKAGHAYDLALMVLEEAIMAVRLNGIVPHRNMFLTEELLRWFKLVIFDRIVVQNPELAGRMVAIAPWLTYDSWNTVSVNMSRAKINERIDKMIRMMEQLAPEEEEPPLFELLPYLHDFKYAAVMHGREKEIEALENLVFNGPPNNRSVLPDVLKGLRRLKNDTDGTMSVGGISLIWQVLMLYFLLPGAARLAPAAVKKYFHPTVEQYNRGWGPVSENAVALALHGLLMMFGDNYFSAGLLIWGFFLALHLVEYKVKMKMWRALSPEEREGLAPPSPVNVYWAAVLATLNLIFISNLSFGEYAAVSTLSHVGVNNLAPLLARLSGNDIRTQLIGMMREINKARRIKGLDPVNQRLLRQLHEKLQKTMAELGPLNTRAAQRALNESVGVMAAIMNSQAWLSPTQLGSAVGSKSIWQKVLRGRGWYERQTIDAASLELLIGKRFFDNDRIMLFKSPEWVRSEFEFFYRKRPEEILFIDQQTVGVVDLFIHDYLADLNRKGQPLPTMIVFKAKSTEHITTSLRETCKSLGIRLYGQYQIADLLKNEAAPDVMLPSAPTILVGYTNPIDQVLQGSLLMRMHDRRSNGGHIDGYTAWALQILLSGNNSQYHDQFLAGTYTDQLSPSALFAEVPRLSERYQGVSRQMERLGPVKGLAGLIAAEVRATMARNGAFIASLPLNGELTAGQVMLLRQAANELRTLQRHLVTLEWLTGKPAPAAAVEKHLDEYAFPGAAHQTLAFSSGMSAAKAMVELADRMVGDEPSFLAIGKGLYQESEHLFTLHRLYRFKFLNIDETEFDRGLESNLAERVINIEKVLALFLDPVANSIQTPITISPERISYVRKDYPISDLDNILEKLTNQEFTRPYFLFIDISMMGPSFDLTKILRGRRLPENLHVVTYYSHQKHFQDEQEMTAAGAATVYSADTPSNEEIINKLRAIRSELGLEPTRLQYLGMDATHRPHGEVRARVAASIAATESLARAVDETVNELRLKAAVIHPALISHIQHETWVDNGRMGIAVFVLRLDSQLGKGRHERFIRILNEELIDNQIPPTAQRESFGFGHLSYTLFYPGHETEGLRFSIPAYHAQDQRRVERAFEAALERFTAEQQVKEMASIIPSKNIFVLMAAALWETVVFHSGEDGWLAQALGVSDSVSLVVIGSLGFAIAHTIVKWIVRAYHAGRIGYRTSVLTAVKFALLINFRFIQQDLRNFRNHSVLGFLWSALALSGLPFAVPLVMALHARHNWRVYRGLIDGPAASILSVEKYRAALRTFIQDKSRPLQIEAMTPTETRRHIADFEKALNENPLAGARFNRAHIANMKVQLTKAKADRAVYRLGTSGWLTAVFLPTMGRDAGVLVYCVSPTESEEGPVVGYSVVTKALVSGSPIPVVNCNFHIFEQYRSQNIVDPVDSQAVYRSALNYLDQKFNPSYFTIQADAFQKSIVGQAWKSFLFFLRQGLAPQTMPEEADAVLIKVFGGNRISKTEMNPLVGAIDPFWVLDMTAPSDAEVPSLFDRSGFDLIGENSALGRVYKVNRKSLVDADALAEKLAEFYARRIESFTPTKQWWKQRIEINLVIIGKNDLYLLVDPAGDIQGYLFGGEVSPGHHTVESFHTSRIDPQPGRGSLLLASYFDFVKKAGVQNVTWGSARGAIGFYHHFASKRLDYRTPVYNEFEAFPQTYGELSVAEMEYQQNYVAQIERRREEVRKKLSELPEGSYEFKTADHSKGYRYQDGWFQSPGSNGGKFAAESTYAEIFTLLTFDPYAQLLNSKKETVIGATPIRNKASVKNRATSASIIPSRNPLVLLAAAFWETVVFHSGEDGWLAQALGVSDMWSLLVIGSLGFAIAHTIVKWIVRAYHAGRIGYRTSLLTAVKFALLINFRFIQQDLRNFRNHSVLGLLWSVLALSGLPFAVPLVMALHARQNFKEIGFRSYIRPKVAAAGVTLLIASLIYGLLLSDVSKPLADQFPLLLLPIGILFDLGGLFTSVMEQIALRSDKSWRDYDWARVFRRLRMSLHFGPMSNFMIAGWLMGEVMSQYWGLPVFGQMVIRQWIIAPLLLDISAFYLWRRFVNVEPERQILATAGPGMAQFVGSAFVFWTPAQLYAFYLISNGYLFPALVFYGVAGFMWNIMMMTMLRAELQNNVTGRTMRKINGVLKPVTAPVGRVLTAAYGGPWFRAHAFGSISLVHAAWPAVFIYKATGSLALALVFFVIAMPVIFKVLWEMSERRLRHEAQAPPAEKPSRIPDENLSVVPVEDVKKLIMLGMGGGQPALITRMLLDAYRPDIDLVNLEGQEENHLERLVGKTVFEMLKNARVHGQDLQGQNTVVKVGWNSQTNGFVIVVESNGGLSVDRYTLEGLTELRKLLAHLLDPDPALAALTPSEYAREKMDFLKIYGRRSLALIEKMIEKLADRKKLDDEDLKQLIFAPFVTSEPGGFKSNYFDWEGKTKSPVAFRTGGGIGMAFARLLLAEEEAVFDYEINGVKTRFYIEIPAERIDLGELVVVEQVSAISLNFKVPVLPETNAQEFVRALIARLTEARHSRREVDTQLLNDLFELGRLEIVGTKENHLDRSTYKELRKLVRTELFAWLGYYRKDPAVVAAILTGVHDNPLMEPSVWNQYREQADISQEKWAFIKLLLSGNVKHEPIALSVQPAEPLSVQAQLLDHNPYARRFPDRVGTYVTRFNALNAPVLREVIERSLEKNIPGASIRSVAVMGSYIYGHRVDPTDLDVYVVVDGNVPYQKISENLPYEAIDPDTRWRAKRVDINVLGRETLPNEPYIATALYMVGLYFGPEMNSEGSPIAKPGTLNLYLRALDLIEDGRSFIDRKIKTDSPDPLQPQPKAFRRLQEASVGLHYIDSSLGIELEPIISKLKMFMEGEIGLAEMKTVLNSSFAQLEAQRPQALYFVLQEILRRDDVPQQVAKSSTPKATYAGHNGVDQTRAEMIGIVSRLKSFGRNPRYSSEQFVDDARKLMGTISDETVLRHMNRFDNPDLTEKLEASNTIIRDIAGLRERVRLVELARLEKTEWAPAQPLDAAQLPAAEKAATLVEASALQLLARSDGMDKGVLARPQWAGQGWRNVLWDNVLAPFGEEGFFSGVPLLMVHLPGGIWIFAAFRIAFVLGHLVGRPRAPGQSWAAYLVRHLFIPTLISIVAVVIQANSSETDFSLKPFIQNHLFFNNAVQPALNSIVRYFNSEKTDRAALVNNLVELVALEKVLDNAATSNEARTWNETARELEQQVRTLAQAGRYETADGARELADMLFILQRVLSRREYQRFVGSISQIPVRNKNADARGFAVWVDSPQRALDVIGQMGEKDRLVLGFDANNKELEPELRQNPQVEELVSTGRLSFEAGDQATTALRFIESAKRSKAFKGRGMVAVNLLIMEGVALPDSFMSAEQDLVRLGGLTAVYYVTKALQAIELDAQMLPDWSEIRLRLSQA